MSKNSLIFPQVLNNNFDIHLFMSWFLQFSIICEILNATLFCQKNMKKETNFTRNEFYSVKKQRTVIWFKQIAAFIPQVLWTEIHNWKIGPNLRSSAPIGGANVPKSINCLLIMRCCIAFVICSDVWGLFRVTGTWRRCSGIWSRTHQSDPHWLRLWVRRLKYLGDGRCRCHRPSFHVLGGITCL